MELKQEENEPGLFDGELLIVPYGIETSSKTFWHSM